MSPDGRRVAWHGEDLDLVVDGSVGTEDLLTVAAATAAISAPAPNAIASPIQRPVGRA